MKTETAPETQSNSIDVNEIAHLVRIPFYVGKPALCGWIMKRRGPKNPPKLCPMCVEIAKGQGIEW